jgi:taurine dioxygenase
LFAIKIPSRGGETLFANLQAAYDALPEAIKLRIAGLKTRVVYRYDATSREGTDEDDPNMASAVHDLVKIHPGSGRKSLYLSRLMTRNVVGMPRAESDALLDELFAHAEKPEFVYAHRWTPGDLLIWDNRAVNHARADFPADEVRLLRRYTVSEPA